MDIETFLVRASVWALPIIIAITLHEAAHGWAAAKLGDDTALMLGRVTFNPLRHIDPFGTLILPGILLLTAGFAFGWAKPVPVNFGRLRRPRQDMVLVAAAGPGMNIGLAIVSAAGLHVAPLLSGAANEWVTLNLQNSMIINVVLAVFNMLPVPPLDGGRVAVGLLPRRPAMALARLEPFGIFIVIGTIILLPYLGSRLGYNIDLFEWLIWTPAKYIIGIIYYGLGLA